MSNKPNLVELRQQHVIAKLIHDPEYRAEVTLFLQVQDFPSANYRKIYAEVKKLIAENRAVDALILKERTQVDPIPSSDILEPNLDYQDAARRIHEEGNKYRVQVLLADFLDKTSQQGFDFNKEFEELRKTLDKPLGTDFGGMIGFEPFEHFVDNLEKNHEPVGRTGIRKLDGILRGLEQTHVYSVIAASGVGKTMMGVQIFVESIKMGTPCMYLSNEMSSDEIVSRILAREINVSALNIRRKEHTKQAEFHKAMGIWADRFHNTGSMILDKAHDPKKAIQALRYYAMKNNIKLVVVDHIHNFSGGSDLYSKISQISHDLQAVAQEMNIAMVVLGQISAESQKSKDVEHVTGKGAKDLEEVSNVVLVLKRKKVEVEGKTLNKEDDPTYMKMIVSKNRDGVTGQTGGKVAFPSMVITQDPLW